MSDQKDRLQIKVESARLRVAPAPPHLQQKQRVSGDWWVYTVQYSTIKNIVFRNMLDRKYTLKKNCKTVTEPASPPVPGSNLGPVGIPMPIVWSEGQQIAL